jgi:BASS family bile acid:Na+ symporter
MSAFMLLAYAGTVTVMPFMAPWLATGFTADPWTIAKPLLFFIAMPMVIGAAIRRVAEPVAERAAPIVKRVTGLNTLVLCAVLLWVYKGEIFSAVGTYAIGSQILCYALLGFASYLLGFGLSYEQKAPMVLGICTRNVGPALATLMGVADAPQGAITMCILAIFLGAILSGFAAAAVLRRCCAPAGQLA